jgi:hypothetical protein
MTTAYTSLLGLALPVTGELSGTWGDTVNTAITSLLDTAVAGTTSITVDADITLSTTTGASNEARQAIILWNPASGTVTRNITAPAQSKLYTVINASGGTQSIVIRGAGPTTGVTIAKGESAQVAWNGSDFVKVGSSGGAITFTDLTVTGNTILGDAAADTLTVNATSTFNAPVNFAGLVRLPSTGRSAAAALTVTAPAFLYGVASTYTDTTSSGTIAAMAPFYALSAPTLSTSNVTTYSFASTLYVAGAPAAGGSATITNPYALYVNSGASYLAGAVSLGSTLAVTGAVTLSGGTANGVLYLNGSKAATSGTALVFDGNTFAVTSAGNLPAQFSSTSASNTLVQITNQNASKDLIQRFRQQGGAGNWFDITMDGATNNLTFDYNDGFLATLTSNGDFVVGRTSANLSSSNRGVIEVNGTSTAYIGLDTGGALRGTLYSDGSLVGLASLASIPLVFGTTAGAEYGRFATNGFFGVGQTAPAWPLSVKSASSGTVATFMYDGAFGGTGEANIGLRFYNGGLASDIPQVKLRAYGTTNYTGNFAVDVMQGGTYPNPFIERFTVQGTTGNVGINKTNPAYRLDVSSGATTAVVARFASALGGTNNNVQLLFEANGGTLWQVGANVGASSNTDRFEFYNTNISGAVVAGITPSGQGWFGKNVPLGNAILQAYGTGEGAYIQVTTSGVGITLDQTGATSDVIFRTTNTSTNFWDYQMNKPSLGNSLQIDYNDVAVLTFNSNRTMKAASTLGVGGTDGSSSGAGITFPASASLSTDVNTLDDYERGSFTPTLAANGGGSITIMTQVGNYTKIGNTVTCTFWVQYSGSTLSGSTVVMTGLPFAKNSSGVRPTPAIRAMGFSSYTNVIGGWLPDGNTAIVLNYYASGSSNDVPGSAVPGGGEYGGTIVYQTNS